METPKKIIVTGGAGFIGSAVVRHLVESSGHHVFNLDKLTYAGNLASLKKVANHPQYQFAQVDICNVDALSSLFRSYKPNAVIHLAAESHVDRSIDGPAAFVDTNVVGTCNMLRVATDYWNEGLKRDPAFRFLHISTDEVFGSLDDAGFFNEHTAYDPRSPYSASKAASDHLVRAWFHTFGLPVVITNCSNNYGPYQFPEKLIPVTILNALMGKPLPVYGQGANVRDWIFVDDHVRALLLACFKGKVGETYLIGAKCQKKNIEVVESICKIMDELSPRPKAASHASLIEFVKDRPGHDYRYAIDNTKVCRDLGWTPQESFESGLKKTVRWYLENKDWWAPILDGSYRLERLGLGTGKV